MSESAVDEAVELTRKYGKDIRVIGPEDTFNCLMSGTFITGLVMVPIFEFSAFIVAAILSLQCALVFLAAVIAANIIAMYLCQKNIKPVKVTTISSPSRIPRVEERPSSMRQVGDVD